MTGGLYAALTGPLAEPFFQKALAGGSVVAIVCGVVGCLVLLRRMAFLGDALSHAMIAGVAVGYLAMKLAFGIEAHAPAMLVGSVLAAILTVGLIGFVSRVSRVKEDAAIGIMYCGVFAGGVVLVSVFRHLIHIDLMHFIMGDVLGVSDTDLWVAAVTAAAVLSFVLLFYRTLQLTTFDPVMAASLGINVVLVDYAFTTCVSLVVVSAVSMVGVILVVGLLITPAATAYLLSDRLHRMMGLAAFFGVSSVVGGLYLSVWLDSAGGGAIMLVSTLQFLVVLALAPRYGLVAGWLRRRRMVPQQLQEDLLGALLREGADGLSLAALAVTVPSTAARLHAAVRVMTEDGLLAVAEGAVRLSDRGREEAGRVRRAHRLWESYLAHVGYPAAEVHGRAHRLEHVNAEDTVGYLDELLGHPTVDPHGAPIPEDPAAAREGAVVALSRLRSGRRGRVASVGTAVRGRLAVGDAIVVAPREDDGATWVVEGPSGPVRLEHVAADAVTVTMAGGASAEAVEERQDR